MATSYYQSNLTSLGIFYVYLNTCFKNGNYEVNCKLFRISNNKIIIEFSKDSIDDNISENESLILRYEEILKDIDKIIFVLCNDSKLEVNYKEITFEELENKVDASQLKINNI
jgi:pyruvate kinase